MSGTGAQHLQPHVEVACMVCGNQPHAVVCSAAEVRAQQAYLESFHRRRLRRADRGSSRLAERAQFTQDYATDIVACTECRLVFRDPRPDAQAIRHAYKHDRYGDERLRALFDSQVELFRPKAQYICRELGIGADSIVVELGSFVGGFLAAGRDCGWNIVGIDPGEEVARFCEEQGLPILRTTIERAALPAASAHCVAIWNTFDQLVDPGTTLRSVRRLLRPGGILALRVPNGETFRRAIALERRLPTPLGEALRAALAWNNLLAFPYLYGHSPPTLDRLVAAYGMRSLALHPDMLTRLADAHTKAWAAFEERLLKFVWRIASRMQVLGARDSGTIAPWFDAYYQVDS